MAQSADGELPLPTRASGMGNAQIEAVYRAEAPRLMRALRRKIWLEDERSELVQEAFLRLVAARSGAARTNPSAYLQGIVRHLLADRVRRWARLRAFALAAEATDVEPPSPEALAEFGQMRDRYRAAVDALPPRTRQVYSLHRAEELEYRVIAEQLGISIRTVEWHVAEAIIRISKSINADG